MPIKTISFTDAREALSSLIDQVQKSGKAIAITRHGRPAAVLVSTDSLKQKTAMERRPWMLRNSGEWHGSVADLEKEIRAIRKEFGASVDRRLTRVSGRLAGK